MKKYVMFVLVALLIEQQACQEPISHRLILQYDQPAKNWNEALPIGNGIQGAMIFGGVNEEIISLNHTEFWSGAPKDWNNSAAASVFPKVLDAMKMGKNKEAEELCRLMQGPYTQSYQPLGDLKLIFKDTSPVTNFYRELDISESLAMVSYIQNGIQYTREYFASYPDKVIVLKITADKKSDRVYFAIINQVKSI